MTRLDYIRAFDLLSMSEIVLILQINAGWELPRACRDRTRRMDEARRVIGRIVRFEGVGDVSRAEVVKLRAVRREEQEKAVA